MKITVIGGGYVGLVTAAGFAEMGNHVLCIETDAEKLSMLKAGVSPIHEPGLEALLHRNSQSARLTFSHSLAQGVASSDVFFIAVGTPPSSDGSPDMSYVHGVARDLGQLIHRYAIVATKSTVPVGTADRISAIIKAELEQRRASVDYDVVSNPEFLKEGAAVRDFMQPERVIIGCSGSKAEVELRKLYAPFMRSHERILVMRPREAEMTKYAANALLATKISFMNEIAELCDELDVDIESVRSGVGSDSRIGHSFLYAGCGYGGSCFPKDIKALIHTAKGMKVQAGILEAVESRNAKQKRRLFDKIVARFGADLKGRTFAMWGLAFKPDTDDVREASSMTMLELLIQAGACVRAFDPIATQNVRKALPRALADSGQVAFCDEQYDALEGSDALLLVTEWKQFRNPDFELMKRRLHTPIIFDGRNQYDPRDVRSAGFEYYGIGRGSVPTQAKASRA